MPAEARWFVETSLACLILASMLGTLHFGWGAVFREAPPGYLRNLHLHLGTVGWLVNMVFGVALWMFPMPRGAIRVARPRYPRRRVIASFIAINAGLALRMAAEPMGSSGLGLICGILQTVGIVIGVSTLWPRIRAISLPPADVPPKAL